MGFAMLINMFRKLLLIHLCLLPAMLLANSDYTDEELERWFNSDSFELPNPTRDVNEGQLVFVAPPPHKALHHHHNSMTILPRSLEDGWVLMEQCHTNLDRVAAAQIVFAKDRVRDIRLLSFRNMERAWVEGPSIQMSNITADARLCMRAWTRALFINDDGSYSLRNGPFMRRFLDGYFPLRVSMEILYAGTGLRPTAVSPDEQKGFTVWRKKDRIGFDAVFEGKLRTVFSFEVETL
jgi:hypothetical protein